MRRIKPIITVLAMVITMTSCSQTRSTSVITESEKNEPEVTSATLQEAVTENQAVETDPTANTNYTKGTFEDGLYNNEYASIKMRAPEDMDYVVDSYLQKQRQQSISSAVEDDDIARQTATIWDSGFANNKDCVYIRFLNTKIAFPDSSDISVDKLMDEYKEWTEGMACTYGFTTDWKKRENVKLGDEEFTREAYSCDENYGYQYMRKLDDDLICIIDINGTTMDRLPEYYEELFE